MDHADGVPGPLSHISKGEAINPATHGDGKRMVATEIIHQPRVDLFWRHTVPLPLGRSAFNFLVLPTRFPIA
ncbi:MAG: hypothetical protein R3D52_10960 [Xanthobacteraceae bacterium]